MTTDNRITSTILSYFARFLWPTAAQGWPAMAAPSDRGNSPLRADLLPEHTWIPYWYEDARRVAEGHEPLVYLHEDITGELLRRARLIVEDYDHADAALEAILDDADGPVTEGVAVNRAIALARAGTYPALDARPTADPVAHALNRAVCTIRARIALRNRKELEGRLAERAPHERAVLLAPREKLESVLLEVAGAIEDDEWDAGTIDDVFRALYRAGFATAGAAAPEEYDGSHVEDHCPECAQSESECVCDDRPTVRIRIEDPDTDDEVGDAEGGAQ
jgi:hypothetical protein